MGGAYVSFLASLPDCGTTSDIHVANDHENKKKKKKIHIGSSPPHTSNGNLNALQIGSETD